MTPGHLPSASPAAHPTHLQEREHASHSNDSTPQLWTPDEHNIGIKGTAKLKQARVDKRGGSNTLPTWPPTRISTTEGCVRSSSSSIMYSITSRSNRSSSMSTVRNTNMSPHQTCASLQLEGLGRSDWPLVDVADPPPTHTGESVHQNLQQPILDCGCKATW